MIIIKLFLKFIKILNSEAAPWQIAAGFAAGVILGFTPLLSVHNLLIGLLIIFVRVNLTSAIVSMGIFKGISLLTGGIADGLGFSLLDKPGLEMMWTFLSQTPVLALFRFNNSLVLGSFVIAVPAAAAVFLFMLFSVGYYRDSVKEKIEEWKLVKYLKMTKIVKLYKTVNRLK